MFTITRGKIAKAQKVVAYGPEGIGKSTFASKFPDPLFSDTEGSTANMDVARLPKASSLEMLNQQIDHIKNTRPCKTFIIDTIDWAEQIVIQSVLDDGQKKSITGFGYGEGFIQLSERMGRLLNKLSDLVDVGINVVLLAHSQIVRFEQPDEMGAYDRYELKLGNKTTARTAALVKEWADMVLFLNYKTYSVATDDKGKKFKGQGGVRTMYTTHHPAWDAKNRHGLPDELPMDYSHIAHIFESVPQAAAPSTPVTQTAPPPVQPVQPVIQSQQTSATEAAPATQVTQEETPSLDPNIPQSLRDLMTQHQVQEYEIQAVVSQKGYYPADTPITNYDQQFIDGVLVGAWKQVFSMIEEFRKSIPFN